MPTKNNQLVQKFKWGHTNIDIFIKMEQISYKFTLFVKEVKWVKEELNYMQVLGSV
jgi:hypothetical protein